METEALAHFLRISENYSWGLTSQSSMVDSNTSHCPNIIYRPIRPSDLEILDQIHRDLFPIRYEPEFFHNVVHSRDIVSWGAVDRSRPDGRSDELIGFVTARIVAADESEIGDMLRRNSLKMDKTLVYILTLGVVKPYRKMGVASSLVRKVINFASNIGPCQGVYLHVLACNKSAIRFYKKMSFKRVRRLGNFYYINGQHYDAYLFVYYVNGGRSPCSPLDLIATVAKYTRSQFQLLTERLWTNEDKKVTGWPKCKESNCLIMSQNKGTLPTENGACQCV